MKMNLTAPAKPDARPFVNHVGVAMSEVFPAIVAFNEARDDLTRLTLESRLAELQHACEMARRAL
jgi:hypothetical protein